MDEQMRHQFENAWQLSGFDDQYKVIGEAIWQAAAALSQPAAQGDSSHSAGGECGGVQAWQPIETAPIIQNPLDTRPPRCLLFTKDGGTHMGAVWRYPEGAIGVNVDNVCGDLDGWITHWMPLPAAPKATP